MFSGLVPSSMLLKGSLGVADTLHPAGNSQEILRTLLQFHYLDVLDTIEFSKLTLSDQCQIDQQLRTCTRHNCIHIMGDPDTRIIFMPTPGLIPLLKLRAPPLETASTSTRTLTISDLTSRLTRNSGMLRLPDSR